MKGNENFQGLCTQQPLLRKSLVLFSRFSKFGSIWNLPNLWLAKQYGLAIYKLFYFQIYKILGEIDKEYPLEQMVNDKDKNYRERFSRWENILRIYPHWKPF